MNDELPDNEPITRFGIITDTEVWRFLQCTRGDDDRPKFRLSREYKIAYGEQGIRGLRAIMEIFLAEAVKVNSTADSTHKRGRNWMDQSG